MVVEVKESADKGSKTTDRVLMDYNVEFDAATVVRGIELNSELPVVALTSYEKSFDPKTCPTNTADSSKP